MQFKLLVQSLALLPFVQLVSAGYEQCGGATWSGRTTCDPGWHCEVLNPYYSQCLPGDPPNVQPTPTTIASEDPLPTDGATSTFTGVIPSATGEGPGSTLRSGYYWIRAVSAPNYRKYLQSSPPRTAGDAIIDNRLTAGQFNVVSGQLVQLIDTSGTLLYAHVTPRAGSENRLKVTWSTEKDTYGTFGWSGDTLTWSTPGISRQNNAAFLVCENQRLYVNLGAYGYMTPAGCADQTIHYYNGAQADP